MINGLSRTHLTSPLTPSSRLISLRHKVSHAIQHGTHRPAEVGGDSLCDCAVHGLVNLGPQLLGSELLDLGPDVVLGEGEGAAVGVVDDGQLVEVEQAVGDVDVVQRVADVSARVAGDEDLWRWLSAERWDFRPCVNKTQKERGPYPSP